MSAAVAPLPPTVPGSGAGRSAGDGARSASTKVGAARPASSASSVGGGGAAVAPVPETESPPSGAAARGDDGDVDPAAPPPFDVPTFACMTTAPVSYVFSTRTTHSDVMSVKVTSTVFKEADRRHIALLSTSRRLHLPASKSTPVQFAFSNAKKSKALVRERDAFMRRLRREREERHVRENLAAVRIQSVWRGHTVRPAPKVRRKPKPGPAALSEDAWREELRALTYATEEAKSGGDVRNDKSDWRKGIQKRADAKRHRRMRKATEHQATTEITKIVRGFLARRAFLTLKSLWQVEAEQAAVVHIQAMFRGWGLRRSLKSQIRAKRQHAATRIQCLARGVAARVRCRWLMSRMRAAEEEDRAAVSLQCAFRSRAARDKVGNKRSTVAAIAVQKSFRGHSVRRGAMARKQSRDEAATKIQAAGRGYIARRRVRPRMESLRKSQYEKEREKAALRIQSVARGRAARRRVAKKRASRAARRRSKEEKGAVMMQKVARGRAARKRVNGIRDAKRREAAATRIQARARGASGRKSAAAKAKAAEERRQEEAARHVQRIARGRAARGRVASMRQEKEEAKAATMITSAARGRAARKRVSNIRKSRREELEKAATDAPRRKKRVRKRGSGASNLSEGSAGDAAAAAGGSSAGAAGAGAGAASGASVKGRPPRP